MTYHHGAHVLLRRVGAMERLPAPLRELCSCLRLVDETLETAPAYDPAMPLTSTPRDIVIVAEPGELHLSVVNRDNGETLLHSEDYDSISNRNRAARDLKKITGWPTVDHR